MFLFATFWLEENTSVEPDILLLRIRYTFMCKDDITQVLRSDYIKESPCLAQAVVKASFYRSLLLYVELNEKPELPEPAV